MKGDAIAKQYDQLTPEERFRLILAAGGRGDKVEQGRLIAAGRSHSISVQDHAPFALAFQDVEMLVFLGLLEEAAGYFEAFHYTGADRKGDGVSEALNLALARGYTLKTKAAGWELFCGRLDIPPFATWEMLPGFDRLRRALKLAERAAFLPEGMLRWVNMQLRPKGAPEATELRLTAEAVADETGAMYRERVRWWGGAA
jgi:hypothetical protein